MKNRTLKQFDLRIFSQTAELSDVFSMSVRITKTFILRKNLFVRNSVKVLWGHLINIMS